MTAYSKYNVIYRLQRWLDSVPGQTFLNYAYSWGASIVILGTLFKLTHLPGANLMLYIGMGTEVVVFFISAFDRPFDKTADGKDLPTHVGELEGNESPEALDETATVAPIVGAGGGVVGGGTIIIGGGGNSGDAVAAAVEPSASATPVGVAGSPVTLGAPNVPVISPEMEEATNDYVEQLKTLTEMLSKVSDQSQRLTRDSEEMENLNRTLTGICKVYEMQLKGASAQIGTIDQINEQSRRMAEQIAELNKIYARMIEAMTVNMPKPVM